MRELSLFSGAGGGLLGTALLGWRPVGYVEFNDYCQRVIAARIKDGILPEAPIFGNIETFISDGYASAYSGLVDVVTGGFPCQPFSVAGKRRGQSDKRNKWPETIECIRLVRPKYFLLENVSNLLNNGYFRVILREIAESGFDAKWKVISAAELGAPHKRDRLWIVGKNTDTNCQRELQQTRCEQKQWNGIGDVCQEISDSISLGCNPGNESARRKAGTNANWSGEGASLGNSTKQRLSDGIKKEMEARQERNTVMQSQRSDWWAVEPTVGRVAHGVANRVDRIKSLGNGQVPHCMVAAWKILSGEI